MTGPFQIHNLDAGHDLLETALPDHLRVDGARFEELWELHPAEYHDVRVHHKLVKTPRWQQAYNRDYVYTGSRNNSLPVPAELQPFWDWAREAIDPRLNSLLVNWYDGALGHYIGPHRDSRGQLEDGAPIVTISLGAARIFRLKPWKREGETRDFAARDGVVFVMPYATNLAWTHQVPKQLSQKGRRISVTLRAFA